MIKDIVNLDSDWDLEKPHNTTVTHMDTSIHIIVTHIVTAIHTMVIVDIVPAITTIIRITDCQNACFT